jgi:hypothetical protein
MRRQKHESLGRLREVVFDISRTTFVLGSYLRVDHPFDSLYGTYATELVTGTLLLAYGEAPARASRWRGVRERLGDAATRAGFRWARLARGTPSSSGAPQSLWDGAERR